MSAETTIKLRTPLTIGDQTIDAVTLCVPSLKDIREIGDPFEVIRFDWGGYYIHTHLERLNHLVRRCITAPADVDAWLDQVGLVDGLEIADTIERLWRATKTAAANIRGLPVNKPKGN
jgi:hypothetical protein